MSKPVSFYSEGVKLAGDLFLPADVKQGDRRAGIVLCHGYTDVRTSIASRRGRFCSSRRTMTVWCHRRRPRRCLRAPVSARSS